MNNTTQVTPPTTEQLYGLLLFAFIWFNIMDLAISVYSFAAMPGFHERGAAALFGGTPHTLEGYLRIVFFKIGMTGLAVLIIHLRYCRRPTLTIRTLSVMVAIMALVVLLGFWQVYAYYMS